MSLYTGCGAGKSSCSRRLISRSPRLGVAFNVALAGKINANGLNSRHIVYDGNKRSASTRDT
jgi:hypothetical protein